MKAFKQFNWNLLKNLWKNPKKLKMALLNWRYPVKRGCCIFFLHSLFSVKKFSLCSIYWLLDDHYVYLLSPKLNFFVLSLNKRSFLSIFSNFYYIRGSYQQCLYLCISLLCLFTTFFVFKILTNWVVKYLLI